jgi:hypothetical protein
MSIHVLGHVLHLPALAGADLRGGDGVGGSGLRLAILAGALVAGAAVAAVTWHLATPWLHRFDA